MPLRQQSILGMGFSPLLDRKKILHARAVHAFGRSKRRDIELFSSGTIVFKKPYKQSDVKTFNCSDFVRLEDSPDSYIVKLVVRIGSADSHGNKAESRKLEFHNSEDKDAFVDFVRSFVRCGQSAQRMFFQLNSSSSEIREQVTEVLKKCELPSDVDTVEAMMKMVHPNQEKLTFAKFLDFFGTFSQNISMEEFVAEWYRRTLNNDGPTISEPASRSFSDEDIAGIPELYPDEHVWSTINNCSWVHELGVLRGILVFSNFRIMFSPYNASLASLFNNLRDSPAPSPSHLELVEVPLFTISRLIVQDKGHVQFQCKNLRRLVFIMDHDSLWGSSLQKKLTELIFPSQIRKCPVFNQPKLRQALQTSGIDGWQLYEPTREYSRQGLLNSHFRLYDNSSFELIPTYPSHFVIPCNKHFSDDDLQKVVSFRSRGRIPAVVWRHPVTGRTLSRSSQPLVGVKRRRCAEDIKLLNLYRSLGHPEGKDLPFFVVDARKVAAATANQVIKGKGVESSTIYINATVEHMNIENIHHMRNSLSSLAESMNVNSDTDALSFHQEVSESYWLRHIYFVLAGSVVMADHLDNDCGSVLCHCSDGWDRTAQMCSITQLLLDPYYRTISGFAVLIEKEWCSFGHRFHSRLGHFDSDHSSQERSPIFLQFLDCVYQLLLQFPDAFEFNETLLVFLADEQFACRTGTFLFNDEATRLKHNLQETTPSVWSLVLGPTLLPSFKNPSFNAKAFSTRLYPSTHPRQIKLWEHYHSRWTVDYQTLQSNRSPGQNDWRLKRRSRRLHSATSHTPTRPQQPSSTALSTSMSSCSLHSDCKPCQHHHHTTPKKKRQRPSITRATSVPKVVVRRLPSQHLRIKCEDDTSVSVSTQSDVVRRALAEGDLAAIEENDDDDEEEEINQLECEEANQSNDIEAEEDTQVLNPLNIDNEEIDMKNIESKISAADGDTESNAEPIF